MSKWCVRADWLQMLVVLSREINFTYALCLGGGPSYVCITHKRTHLLSHRVLPTEICVHQINFNQAIKGITFPQTLRAMTQDGDKKN